MSESWNNLKGKSFWFYIVVAGQAYSILFLFMKAIIIRMPFVGTGEYGFFDFSNKIKEVYEASGDDYSLILALLYLCVAFIVAAAISAVLFFRKLHNDSDAMGMMENNAAATIWLMLIGAGLFWFSVSTNNKFLCEVNYGSGLDAFIGDYYGDILSVKGSILWAIVISIACLVGRSFCIKEIEKSWSKHESEKNDIEKSFGTIKTNENKVCPNCGAQSSDGEFCVNCGSKLIELKKEKVCQVCGAKYEEGRFCKKCGAEHPIQSEEAMLKNEVENNISDRQTEEIAGENVEKYKAAAEKGDPYSQYVYAGMVIDKDPKEAEVYYTKAAEQGNIKAMRELALNYSEEQNLQSEKGFGHDSQKEFYWTVQAAENGDTDSMLRLAVNYGSGGIVKKDGEEERRWLQKAADLGNAEACYRLYSLPIYQYNKKERVEFLRKAIEACGKSKDKGTFSKATFALGSEYLPRRNNDIEDKRIAIYFLYLSFFSGNDEALKETEEMDYFVSPIELAAWKNDAESMQVRM